MRIGLYGGSFDPIHFGHLVLAEQCREQCELDEVWFLPTKNPPHKTVRNLTSGKMRVEMLNFATAGNPRFLVNELELDREGTSYTVDTLEHLTRENGDRELFFLIGGDSLQDFPTWRNPARITELATVVAVNRGRQPLAPADSFPEEFRERVYPRIKQVIMPAVDLSATDIRERVRQGKSIRYMVPRAVEMYIREQRLYRSTE